MMNRWWWWWWWWWIFGIVSWPYTVMRISTYTPLAHVKYKYICIWSTTTSEEEVVDCQKVACKYINNASIYSSPPIYLCNNNFIAWVIDFTWMNFFFIIQGMKCGKCSSIHVVEWFYYMGILNLSLEFFFVGGGMKCGKKWSSKAIYNWKPWMTLGGVDEFSLEP
jgi:hypothetical protein